MDHLKIAQSLVDDVKESMPEGVYFDLMREFRDAYDTFGVIYKISYVEIRAIRKDDLSLQHKSMLVEEVDVSTRPHWCWAAVFNTGTMPPPGSWECEHKTAFVRNTICVIKDIEQIQLRKKRKTEEAE